MVRRSITAAVTFALIALGALAAPAYAATVNVGSCFNVSTFNVLSDTVYRRALTPVPCTKRHNAEVVSIGTLPGATEPTVPKDLQAINDACGMSGAGREDIQRRLGLPVDYDILLNVNITYQLPTPAQWKAGSRWVRCMAFFPLDERRTKVASYTGSARTYLKAHPAYAMGCTRTVPADSDLMTMLPCTSPGMWIQFGSPVLVENGPDVDPHPPYDSVAWTAITAQKCQAAVDRYTKPGTQVKVALASPAEWANAPSAMCFVPVDSLNPW